MLFCLAAALSAFWLAGCMPASRQQEAPGRGTHLPASTTPEGESLLSLNLTPTPFLPIHNLSPTETIPAPTVRAEEPTATPQDPLDFYGIDFTNQKRWVSIQIQPPDGSVNRGKAIFISFIPGQRCIFGDRHGCIHTFTNHAMGAVTFITVHSGVGGEGQRFRNAVEGTGINRAAFPLKRVQANLEALLGADAAIAQGERVIGGLKLVALARIPATSLAAYFNTPLDQALDLAGTIDPPLVEGINPAQPQLVFETCGWKMPGEAWAPSVTSTTGSIYLGVIQKAP
jgi:hypothetical protein